MRGRMVALVAGAAIGASTLLPSASAFAAEAWPPGLAVGAQAPKFELVDSAGEKRASESWLVKDRFLAVLFYRSANW